MDKKSALLALNNQKDKIKNGLKPELWINTTSELLKKIFPISGESKSKQISDIYFYPFLERNPHLIEQQVQKGRAEAERYMLEFIEEINIAGLERTFEDNKILQLIKNQYFWIVISTLIGATYILGLNIGKSSFVKDKESLSQKYEVLEKEIMKKE
jgi:hypothetical protein